VQSSAAQFNNHTMRDSNSGSRLGRPGWQVWGVLLFTILLSEMFWLQSSRSEAALKDRVLAQAEQRSLQVAHAMAGQMDNSMAAMGLTLRELRRVWQTDRPGFDKATQMALRALPGELAEQLTVVDGTGQVVYSSLGMGLGISVADRDYFRDLAQGGDRVLISHPVLGRLLGERVFLVAMPLLRDGQFDGSIQIVVPSRRIAGTLSALQIGPGDSIALVHNSGKCMGCSRDNRSVTTSQEPPERPYLRQLQAASGTLQYVGASPDDVHTVGWYRLKSGQATVIVDLAHHSVLAPLEPALRRSWWTSRLLIALTLAGGLSIAWLLYGLGRSRQVMMQSSEDLSAAQRLAKVGNWRIENPGGGLECSDEMQRILGVELGGGLLDRQTLFDRIPPEDRSHVETQLQRLSPDCPALEFEHRLICADGGTRMLHVIVSAEVAHGVITGVKGTVQDVSEAREAQQSLARLNQDLERRVRERTRELERSKRDMDAFAYSVSHDLRAPLRGIQGFTALLAEESERLTPEGRSYLGRVQESTGYMNALIADLLLLAQHSRAPLECRVVNLSELAQSIVNELQHSEPTRQVVCEIEPDLVAWCDPMLTRDILQNLLGNAWKYTGRREDARIRFRCTGRRDGLVEFCVSDNGAGFDMAHAGQLFQPFKRLHARTQFEGTGVGLATVQRMVQRHGGDVRGEGRVDEGATFWFTLPEQSMPAL
jgi:PAS domain S-box-containing protein